MSSSPTRHVVVDDQDPAIQYIGPGWTTSSGTAEASFGNFGPVYDDTLHLVSNTPGSSLRFEFSGTSVSMMGSIDNTGNKTLPSWQCFLDGQLFGQTSFPGITENNQVLCNVGSLSDGTHSVEVNVKTSGPTFYFDYVVYDPSPSVSLSDSVILIDNTDPSISLSGSGWVNRYGNLWPLTSTAGDQMTLKFVGKSVTALGIAPGELSGNPTTGTYTVDGLQPTSFVIPGHGDLAEFNQVYFTTPDFDPGPHTLVITHQGNSNTAPFVLDLFYVANGAETLQASPSATNQNQATSGTLHSTSASTLTSASIGGHTITNSSTSPSASGGHPAAVSSRVAPSASESVGGSPAASNSAAPEGAHSGHSTHIGAIIGGIVGGLALIVVVFLVFLFCRRRSTQRRPTGMTPITDMEVRPFARNTDSLITPFLPAHSVSYFAQPDALHGAPDLQPLRGSAKASAKTRRVSVPSIPAPPLNHPASTPERPSTGVSASSSLPGTETTSDSASGRRMSGWRVVHHEDSGVRMRGATEGEVIDLPPTYTAD